MNYLINRISLGMKGIMCLEIYKFSMINASFEIFLARFCIRLAYNSETRTT